MLFSVLDVSTAVASFWVDARVQFLCFGFCGCLLVGSLVFSSACLIAGDRSHRKRHGTLLPSTSHISVRVPAEDVLCPQSTPDPPPQCFSSVEPLPHLQRSIPSPHASPSSPRPLTSFPCVSAATETNVLDMACAPASYPRLGTCASSPATPRTRSCTACTPLRLATPQQSTAGPMGLTPNGETGSETTDGSPEQAHGAPPSLYARHLPQTLEHFLASTSRELVFLCDELTAAEEDMLESTVEVERRILLSHTQVTVE